MLSERLQSVEPADIMQRPAVTKSRKDRKWTDMISRLQSFYYEAGHSLVPKDHPDRQLYKWTLSVRRNYRHQALGYCRKQSVQELVVMGEDDKKVIQKRQVLSKDKLLMLQELDFPWDVQAILWKRRYEQLLEYKQEHGHSHVPANCREYPGLGVWVRNQRREHRKLLDEEPSTLSQERLDALESLGFKWYTPHARAWEARFQELVAFKKQHGHAHVPEVYHDNPPLGQWCMNQRTNYKLYCSGEPTGMTAERIEKLQEIGFAFSLRETRWLSMKDRLKAYYDQHGHIKIAVSDAENNDLRIWLRVQRYLYNQEQLADHRIEALEKIMPDFSWKARGGSGPKAEDWAKLFDAMREKGITPYARQKEHWFEGVNPFTIEVKDKWTEQDLLELWNQQDDEDDDDYNDWSSR